MPALSVQDARHCLEDRDQYRVGTMRSAKRTRYFEAVCLLGVIALAVAYSISEFHFTLTLLFVVVLGIVALIHDTAIDSKIADTQEQRRPKIPESHGSRAHRASSPQRETSSSSNLPRSSA